MVALLAGLCLLAACTNQFGAGFAELPADRGWQPLPIGDWVLNDGIEPRTIVYCPREHCAHQAIAALISFDGKRADEMERALASDPARLAREFAKPTTPPKPDKTKAKSTAPKDTAPKSTTSVSRYDEDGAKGLLVEIRAKDAAGKHAATAIVYGRDAGKLTIAVAVSDEADRARSYARSAWNSR
ncbi:hypothetical protein DWF00_08190 [Bosea caraganae]|uniref:Uncharacterized protein n=1 Tax=Bosea caraganae TaxID=2763117 RepID=A0A370L019_9HYPH|nr:hypothetical protein DWE98_24120 [Bosea caraganae]RDJ28457.1 hypothetical protein DWF00_08190 [Bosea caraganae]